MSAQTYLIIGGGMAGGRAAETLRTAGFDGRICLVCAESDLPYQRPPLSKEYLRGERDATSLFFAPFGVLRSPAYRAAYESARRAHRRSSETRSPHKWGGNRLR